MRPGSNADKTGGFQVGDALFSCTALKSANDTETKVTRPNLEGLDYDNTLDVIGDMAGKGGTEGYLAIGIQRLIQRKTIITEIIGPTNEPVMSFEVLAGYGTNLRTALQSNNIKMYDDRTSRFDSPFQTGNCGGEGTCGTCLVSVLEGTDLVSKKAGVEEKALKVQAVPPNYRWACRMKIGTDASRGGTVRLKLRPQSQV